MGPQIVKVARIGKGSPRGPIGLGFRAYLDFHE